MKMIVLGSGVTGVATAWYLNQMGHDVTVIDRASGPALETSFGNAGELSFAYSTPWAAPGIPQKALKWMIKSHSPLIIHPDGSSYQLKWLKMMLKNCNAVSYKTNKERMVRIAEYSREMFANFEEETGVHFEGRRKGTLQIFRHDKEVASSKKDLAVLAEYGLPYKELSPHECVEYEPALKHVVHKLAGAIHMPNDRTGDCFLFTNRLADLCREKGVVFEFNRPIERFETQGKAIRAVYAGGQRFEADHFICCLGSFSRPVLAQLGLDVPIYPIKGYSLTIPVTDDASAPMSTVLDETYKVAITRFDKRIRVGGMAELSGYQLNLLPARRETLELVVRDLYPNGGDVAHAQFWSGLRPTTPDSVPLIGYSGWDNLTLNTGHGTLGWTMSLGSGKVAADLASGNQAAIRTDDLGINRYR